MDAITLELLQAARETVTLCHKAIDMTEPDAVEQLADMVEVILEPVILKATAQL